MEQSYIHQGRRFSKDSRLPFHHLNQAYRSLTWVCRRQTSPSVAGTTAETFLLGHY